MSGYHICYVSKRCRFCQGFLEELSKTPFSKDVRLVCVDPSPSRPPLPAWLKVVPTLILADGEEPLIGPLAVNNWLFSKKMMQSTGSSVSSSVDPSKKLAERNESIRVPTYSPDLGPPQAAPKQGKPTAAGPGPDPAAMGSGMEGPEAWHSSEMAGGKWSDSYSFVGGGDFSSEKGFDPIVRNFELLNGPPGMGGGGNAGGAAAKPAAKRSVKEEKLLNDFEAFSKARDMDFSGPKRIG